MLRLRYLDRLCCVWFILGEVLGKGLKFEGEGEGSFSRLSLPSSRSGNDPPTTQHCPHVQLVGCQLPEKVLKK